MDAKKMAQAESIVEGVLLEQGLGTDVAETVAAVIVSELIDAEVIV